MAVYQDLLDAIARVRAGTGDADAWMRGLSGADLAVAANLVAVRTPGAIDTVLAKIRGGHPELFDPPPTAPATKPTGGEQQPGSGQGSAAEAIRTAETALAHQNSATAQVDLQVITAVLNAHASDVGARAALEGLQRDIEAAVAGRTDLDTPAGARGFRRYLIDKLHDIRTVVETAGLDATSKAALVAALTSLYATPLTEATERSVTAAGPAVEPPDPPAVAAEGGDEALLDDLLGPDVGPAPVAAAPALTPAPAPATMIPSLPVPGAGSPGLGAPLGGGWTPAAPGGAALPTLPAGLESAPIEDGPPAVPDGPAAEDEAPAEDDEVPPEDSEDRDDDGAAPGDDQDNVVRLPDGEMVAAATPELAAVIRAAVAGTPIAEAFAQQHITIPPPGSPVADAVDLHRLVAGDVGILTDRHALALGNGSVLLDNRIQPAVSVSGPGFLGWEHPPVPGPTPSSTTSAAPTPTRPAVTAGPSG